MKNYQEFIDLLKRQLSQLAREHFVPAQSGTRHHVFLSTSFVLRIHKSSPTILFREEKILSSLSHPLAPPVPRKI